MNRVVETPASATIASAIAAERPARLVAEMAHPGKDHRDAGFVGRGDHLLVPDRPARLDHGGGAGRDGCLQADGEGEEGA